MGNDKSLRIAIAGGGLGGLAAACRLAQDGHSVHVFERTEDMRIATGAIYIQSNAVRCIRRWGLGEAFQPVITEIGKTQNRDGYTNALLSERYYSQFSQIPIWASDRRAIQRTFFEEGRRLGATVTFGTAITDVSETSEQAIVSCEDGQTHIFDLFIAADGISSRLRAKILPECDTTRVAPIPALSTFYQAELTKDVLLSHELTKSLVSGEDSRDSLIFVGKGGYAVFKYSHSRRVLNIIWSIKHEPGSEEDKNPRLFDVVGDPALVQGFFSSFHP